MKKVTPREFRNAFLAVMKAEYSSFRTAAGFEAKSYTYFMRTNIFPKIARQLGLMAWNKEYYSLGGMFYEERGRHNFGKYTTYAKWIAVALAPSGNIPTPIMFPLLSRAVAVIVLFTEAKLTTATPVTYFVSSKSTVLVVAVFPESGTTAS